LVIRRSILAIVVGALLLSLFVAARRHGARAQVQAAGLLQWAEHAQHTVPHTGLLVTTTFLGTATLTSEVRIARLGPGRCRIDYLSPPLQGVYAIEDGHRIWRYDPIRGVVYTDEQPMRQVLHPRQRFALLLRNYLPLLAGRARIAGRDALRLELVHRRSRQRARLFWVDAATGLILRHDEYQHDGVLSARTAYREVSFAPPSARVLRVAHPGVPVVRHTVAPLPEELLAWVVRPRYAPPGFVFEGASGSQCACSCGRPVAHLHYFDGLRSVSVFQCGHGGATAGGRDPVPLPHGNLVRVDRRGATFFIIGDAEPQELRRMAESLR
jgi:negative regulator of sigma E activity